MAEQLHPALFEERDLLEGLSPVELREIKTEALKGMSDRERIVNLVNDVLDGYGV